MMDVHVSDIDPKELTLYQPRIYTYYKCIVVYPGYSELLRGCMGASIHHIGSSLSSWFLLLYAISY